MGPANDVKNQVAGLLQATAYMKGTLLYFTPPCFPSFVPSFYFYFIILSSICFFIPTSVVPLIAINCLIVVVEVLFG